MRIHLRYLNILRNVIGVKEDDVDLPGEGRVIDLLNMLGERYGEKARVLLFKESDRDTPNPLLRIAAEDDPRFLSSVDLLAEGKGYDLFIATFGG